LLEVSRSKTVRLQTTIPTVSVVIPAYNAMRYLPLTLHSVLAQTYQDFEVIIVNDGSKDGIEAWYSQLSDSVKSKVKLISQPNRGTCAARNCGIASTQSPYIAFLDSDDIWLPTKLARQVEMLNANPDAGLVYSWSAAIDADGAPVGRIYAGRVAMKPTVQEVWAGMLVKNEISTPSAVLMRRSCLNAVGDFDPVLGAYVEDKDLWLRVARDYRIQLMPEVLLHKRRHAANTSKQWAAMEHAAYQVIEKALKTPPEGISEGAVQQLRQRSYAFLYRQLAWKPLQTEEVKIGVSLRYLLNAWRHLPILVCSKESLKLMSVMVALMLMGTQRYRWSLRRLSRVRSCISNYKKIGLVNTSARC